jgi:hypothetical protein
MKSRIIEAYRQQGAVAKKARLFDVIGTQKRVDGELATVAYGVHIAESLGFQCRAE